MGCSPSLSGNWERESVEGAEVLAGGVPAPRSVWSASSLLALSNGPARPKAGASSAHSKRFARQITANPSQFGNSFDYRNAEAESSVFAVPPGTPLASARLSNAIQGLVPGIVAGVRLAGAVAQR